MYMFSTFAIKSLFLWSPSILRLYQPIKIKKFRGKLRRDVSNFLGELEVGSALYVRSIP